MYLHEKKKELGAKILVLLPFVKFLNAVNVCVHTVSLTNGWTFIIPYYKSVSVSDSMS